MVKKTVGIITRTLDRPVFIERSLKTVLDQKFTGWKLVIINDGGAKAPLDAVVKAGIKGHKLARDQVQVIHCKTNIGRSAAFNKGLAALDTDFIACLDDDDTWDPAFLEHLVPFYEKTMVHIHDLVGVGSHVTAIQEDMIEEKGVKRIEVLGEEGLPPSFRRKDFLLNRVAYSAYRQDLLPVQWIMRRDAALSVGGFPEDFDLMEDRVFLMNLLVRGSIALLDKPLAFHHRRVARTEDTDRDTDLNTLDNPSYNWSLYADKIDRAVQYDRELPIALTDIAEKLHQVGATVIREINAETSALWHRVSSIEKRQQEGPRITLKSLPEKDIVFDLWREYADAFQGHPIMRGTPFMERFELSQNFDREGNLMNLDASRRHLIVQIPECRNWSALEFNLDGLVAGRRGLRIELGVTTEVGYLFQTGLSVWQGNDEGQYHHSFADVHVHNANAHEGCLVQREFSADLLGSAQEHKFSIIMPKQAVNYTLACREFRVSLI